VNTPDVESEFKSRGEFVVKKPTPFIPSTRLLQGERNITSKLADINIWVTSTTNHTANFGGWKGRLGRPPEVKAHQKAASNGAGLERKSIA